MVLILDVESEHVSTCEGKWVFSENIFQICESFQSKPMPETDQITDFTPHLRTYF